MNKAQQKKYQSLYQSHVNALHRQGKAKTTIDVYSRAVRRITEFYDQCPDRLTQDQLKDYFSALVKSHSWSTVKVDRNGLQFFYKHILGKNWVWVDIVKPPQKKVLPDILSVKEVEHVINGTRELRYQTFLLTAYSMGLRLGEALNLQVGDVDGERMKVHVRQGKGRKDRFVTLPLLSLQALRRYWATHRHPSLRHCYGAHLVETGLNLRAIQHEMGHECPKTTALYTQLTDVTHQNTDKMINRLVNRLRLKLDGEV